MWIRDAELLTATAQNVTELGAVRAGVLRQSGAHSRLELELLDRIEALEARVRVAEDGDDDRP